MPGNGSEKLMKKQKIYSRTEISEMRDVWQKCSLFSLKPLYRESL